MRLSAEELARVRTLYEQGLLIQAYAAGSRLGPMSRWEGTDAQIMAGRLAHNLGAPRLGRALHRRAWRENRVSAEAAFYCAYSALERHGPLAAWQFMRRVGEFPSAAAEPRADWLALHGRMLGYLRDFDRAEEYQSRAEAIAPGRPWLCVERAHLLDLEDRYEESLQASRTAMELRPGYRPAIQSMAHTLGLLNRDGEALELLREAAERYEAGSVVAQLAALQTELGHYVDARRSFDRLVELSPLMEADLQRWLWGHRSDAAYYCGDYATAAQLARFCATPFHAKVAESLAAGGADGKRVLLGVPFVRQHHVTCAPATLAAVGRYWSMPAEHLEIVEEICYDGTPAHNERRWADEHGYVTAEFTVTWESAVALLDRGVPFTLATVEVTSAHLQACIGYDSRRRTLLIRDPYERHFGEFIADAFFERYRPFGPRGMAMVPKEKAHLLEGLSLPDAALYDAFYEVARALGRHDRAAAQEACGRLSAAAPNDRLTHWANRALAGYDADPTRQLACVEELLKLYPDNAVMLLSKLGLLRNLSRQDERLSLLESICARKDSDPTFWQQYAQELATDARQHRRAEGLLRRALRYRPTDPGSHYILGNVLWSQRRVDEAMELYRLAACLDDKDEQLAMAFFGASRHFKQTEQAMAMLRGRFRRFGKRSGQPARTFFRAAASIERTREAFDTLVEALRLRPDDGELLLYAADAYGRHGSTDHAGRLLSQAEGRTRDAARWRTAAALASYRGELKASLVLWQRVLEAEPLASDAQAAVTQLLAETVSRAAAMEHLADQAKRFPHHYPLHQLWVEWLREADLVEYERVVRHVVSINGADAWAHRELALCLGRQGRYDEALAAADEAVRLDPHGSYSHSVRARILAARGDIPAAREACRRAIQLSVDNDAAIAELIATCASPPERREAVLEVKEQLVRQVMYGEGLLAFRHYAGGVLEDAELLTVLREALESRPDLWHAWSAMIRQLVDTGQLAEALSVAQRATERFPLLPALWLDLSIVQQLGGDASGEIESLQQALQISPGWGIAVRRLAGAHERAGDMEKSRELLEQAVAWAPLDAFNHGCLADALWKLGRRDAAIERLQHAVTLDPDYDWAWRRLAEWAAELNRPELAPDVARDLVKRRGGEARSWLILARALSNAGSADERLAAIDRAVTLEPRNSDAHDLRAMALAEAGRFDEALAACSPQPWGDRPPMHLQARRAWVLYRQGQADQAIAAMKSLVIEDPGLVWAWYQLAEWHRERGDQREYRSAAEELVRLAPYEPQSHGNMGAAREAAGDTRGAEEAYRRALELAPDYSFAGASLFDLQLKRGALDEAAATLAVLTRQVPGPHTQARAVMLAAARKQERNALRQFGELCLGAFEDPWPLHSAHDALVDAGYTRQAMDALWSAQTSPAVNPNVTALWVRLRTRAGDRRVVESRVTELCREMDKPPEARDRRVVELARRAVSAYLTTMCDMAQTRAARRFVRRNAPMLRADSRLWGTAAYGLGCGDAHHEVLAWMRDWEKRLDIEPWMLLNLVYALRSLGQDAAAGEVGRRAMELPGDGSVNGHLAWLAYDLVVAGRPAEAQPLLDRMRAPLADDDALLAEVLKATIAVQTAVTGRRQFEFDIARARFRAAKLRYQAFFRGAIRLAYQRCAKTMARAHRTLAARWFAWIGG